MTLGLSARSLTLLVASTFRRSRRSEYLVAGTPASAEQVTGQRTIGGAGKDGIEIAFQRALVVFHCRDSEVGDVSCETEGAVEPKLEPHACQIAAMLGNKANLAVEMGQASLVEPAMPLLGGIAVRYPHLGLMAIHRVAHDLRCTRELGGMDNGLGRTEHPLVGIASFDPRACLVAGHDLGIAQGSKCLLAPDGENWRCGT